MTILGIGLVNERETAVGEIRKEVVEVVIVITASGAEVHIADTRMARDVTPVWGRTRGVVLVLLGVSSLGEGGTRSVAEETLARTAV